MARKQKTESTDAIAAAQEFYDEALKALGRANIALIGSAGVGKSTLINAMFEFDLVPDRGGRLRDEGDLLLRAPVRSRRLLRHPRHRA